MHYITAEDKTRLEDQLTECVGKRKTLSDRIGRARELGDLKENAEYHAAKEEQGLNERRIRELEEKLATAVVADTEHLPDNIVFIGATVYDNKFHAFDARTGRLLWDTTLPAAGNATPAVYEVGGKEYVVIGAGGGKWGAPSGGTYLAFALP